jgi:hypothetical protein
MIRFFVVITIALLIPFTALAGDIIEGRYCYTYGDRESIKEAREVARSLAIRNAIESYHVYINSISQVKNFKLTDDSVRVISAGYLNNIKTLEHTEYGRTICDTIQAMVEPERLKKALDKERNKIEKRTTKKKKAPLQRIIYKHNSLKIINIKKKTEHIVYPPENRLIVDLLITDKWLPKENRIPGLIALFYDETGDLIDKQSKGINAYCKGFNVFDPSSKRRCDMYFKIPEGTQDYKIVVTTVPVY